MLSNLSRAKWHSRTIRSEQRSPGACTKAEDSWAQRLIQSRSCAGGSDLPCRLFGQWHMKLLRTLHPKEQRQSLGDVPRTSPIRQIWMPVWISAWHRRDRPQRRRLQTEWMVPWGRARQRSLWMSGLKRKRLDDDNRLMINICCRYAWCQP